MLRITGTGPSNFYTHTNSKPQDSYPDAITQQGLQFMENMLGQWGAYRPGPAIDLLVRLINDSECLGKGYRQLELVNDRPKEFCPNIVYVRQFSTNRFRPLFKKEVKTKAPLRCDHDPELDGLLAAACAGFEGWSAAEVRKSTLIELRCFLRDYLNNHWQQYVNDFYKILADEDLQVLKDRQELKREGYNDFGENTSLASCEAKGWQPKDAFVFREELENSQLRSAGQLCDALPDFSWTGAVCRTALVGTRMLTDSPGLTRLGNSSQDFAPVTNFDGQANLGTGSTGWEPVNNLWQYMQQAYNAASQLPAYVDKAFSFPSAYAEEMPARPTGAEPFAVAFNTSATWQDTPTGEVGEFLNLGKYIEQPSRTGARQPRALSSSPAPSTNQPTPTPQFVPVPLVQTSFNITQPTRQEAARELLKREIADRRNTLLQSRGPASISTDNATADFHQLATLLRRNPPDFENFLNLLLTQWRRTQDDSFVLALCGGRTSNDLFAALQPALSDQTLAQANALIESQINAWLPQEFKRPIRSALCKLGATELGTPFKLLTDDAKARIRWDSDEHLMVRLAAKVAQGPGSRVALQGPELVAIAHVLTNQALAHNQTAALTTSALVLDWVHITGRFATLPSPTQWQAAGEGWVEEFKQRPAQQASEDLSKLIRSLSEPPPSFNDLCTVWAKQLSGRPEVTYEVRSIVSLDGAYSSTQERQGSLAQVFKDSKEHHHVKVKIEIEKSPWGKKDRWITLDGRLVLEDYDAQLQSYGQKIRAGFSTAVTLLLRRELGGGQLKTLIVPQARGWWSTYVADKGCVLLVEKPDRTQFPYAVTFGSGNRIESLTPIEFSPAEEQAWGLTDIQSKIKRYVRNNRGAFFEKVTGPLEISDLTHYTDTEAALYDRLYDLTNLAKYVEDNLEAARKALNVQTPWELLQGFLPGAACFTQISNSLRKDTPLGVEHFLAGVVCGTEVLNVVPMTGAGGKLATTLAKFFQSFFRILLSQGGAQAAKMLLSSTGRAFGKDVAKAMGNLVITALETSGLPASHVIEILFQELRILAGSAKLLAQQLGPNFAQEVAELQRLAIDAKAKQEALLQLLERTTDHQWRIKPGIEPAVQIGQDGRAYLQVTGGEEGGVFLHTTENGDRTLLITTGTPDNPLYPLYHPLTGGADASKLAFKPARPDQTLIIRGRQVSVYRTGGALYLRQGKQLRSPTLQERFDLYATGTRDALPPRVSARLPNERSGLPNGRFVELDTARYPYQTWGLLFAGEDRPVVAEVENQLFALAPTAAGDYQLRPLSSTTLREYRPMQVAQDFKVWRIDGRRYRAQGQPNSLQLKRLSPAEESRFAAYLEVKDRLKTFDDNPAANGVLDLSGIGNNIDGVLEQALDHAGVYHLNLRNNQLQSIPEWTGRLPRHYTLDLRGNPISQEAVDQYLAASHDGMMPTILLDQGLTLHSQCLPPDIFRPIRVKMPDGLVRRIEAKHISVISRRDFRSTTRTEYFQAGAKTYRLERRKGELDRAVELPRSDRDYAPIQQCISSPNSLGRVKRGGNFSCLRRGQAENAGENLEMQQGVDRQAPPPQRAVQPNTAQRTRSPFDRLADAWSRVRDDVSVPKPIQPLPADQLPQQVKYWTSTKLAAKYQDFIEEPGAGAFAGFLEGLQHSLDAVFKETAPVTRQRIGAVLEEANTYPELRELIFEEAGQALGACEDRPTLSLNRMEELVLAHKAARGDLSQPELLEAGRSFYRLSRVDYYAHERVIKAQDQVTARLSIEIALRDQLNLPGQTRHFLGGRGTVENKEIDRILNSVLADESANNGENLRDFLTNWDPWRSHVDHTKSSKLEEINAPFHEQLDRLEVRANLPKEDSQHLAYLDYMEQTDNVVKRREQASKQFYRAELETALDDLPGTSQMNQPEAEANELEDAASVSDSDEGF